MSKYGVNTGGYMFFGSIVGSEYFVIVLTSMYTMYYCGTQQLGAVVSRRSAPQYLSGVLI